MKKHILLISLLLFLYGCGGGSTTKESLPLKTLYLVDSPVNGVEYECGIRKFTTQFHQGKDGVALCRHAPVTFKIGSLVLGIIEKIKDEQSIYPQDLVGVSRDNFEDERVLKLSLLLQSLDNDGAIEQKIDIDTKMSREINISSITKLNIEEISQLINDWGKTALSLESVKKHLEEHSGLVKVNDMNVTVTDTKAIGSTIALLNMTNSKNISNIQMLSGEGADAFVIENNGSIKVAKALNFKEKNSYTFQIQATNPIGKSNIAELLIQVTSGSSEDLSFIEKPTLLTTSIFTKSNEYNLSIRGRRDTEIYIDGTKQETKMPLKGKITFSREILGEDRVEEHSVFLAYPNGIKSEPTLCIVTKDTIEPKILQDENISIQENSTIVANIPVEDAQKEQGLEYRLIGEDAHFFVVSNVGDIQFRLPSDFEIPKDADTNNIYDFNLTVEDRAGNQSSQCYHVSVENILDSKPTILPFYEEISNSISIGSTIGKVVYTEGDSPLSSLTLTGNGSDKFQLNKDGSLLLLENIEEIKDFSLTITATNEFGSRSQIAFIHVVEGNQLGKLEIRTLRNATVKLIKLNADNSKELLDVNQTNINNTFQLRSDLLEDESFYIYEVSGGFYLDTHKRNEAIFRLISKGSWIKQSSKKVKITPMSEILYDYVAHYVKNDYMQIEAKLNESSKILISKDLNNDFTIDAKDLLGYSDHENATALYRTLKENSNYTSLKTKMMDNNSSYLNSLFNTRVLKEFENADAFQQVGSFIYYFNAKNGTFYIYDMNNKINIAELFIEAPKYENNIELVGDDDVNIENFFNQLFSETNSFRPSLKVNLQKHRLYLTNFNYKTFVLDISKLRSPSILGAFESDVKSTIIGEVGENLFIHAYLFDLLNAKVDEEAEFTNIFNLEELNNVKKTSLNFGSFDNIYDGKSYLWNTSGCTSENNTLTLTTRDINDLISTVDKPNIFEIYSYYCDEKAFFHHNRAYVYDTRYLEIYSIGEESLSYEAIKKLEISKILNVDNNKLFSYFENVISFVNIANVSNPFVEKTLPYYVEEDFFGETLVLTDNLPIAIKDGYFITTNQIIDLNTFMLSALYTETGEELALELFKKFEE